MTISAVRGWLLDTHALLWMLYGDRRLSPAARRVIEGSEPLAYSTASFWEIGLKQGREGFDFEIEADWDRILPAELERIHVARWDIEASDCRKIETLPRHHKDPFDRMLIAQARNRRFGILTKDAIFTEYAIPVRW